MFLKKPKHGVIRTAQERPTWLIEGAESPADAYQMIKAFWSEHGEEWDSTFIETTPTPGVYVASLLDSTTPTRTRGMPWMSRHVWALPEVKAIMDKLGIPLGRTRTLTLSLDMEQPLVVTRTDFVEKREEPHARD